MKKITIHQPEHLPWLGTIEKICQVDTFVVLDNVQFRKNFFHNRNKIRSMKKEGFSWITVPIKNHRLNTNIKDIEIAPVNHWKEKYLNVIKENYNNSHCFKQIYPEIKNILLQKYETLISLNMALLNYILCAFEIPVDIVFASNLNLTKTKGANDIVFEICKILNTDYYYSGATGLEYLDFEHFQKEKIHIEIQNFKHPIYPQVFKPFLPGMSCIDYLFRFGGGSIKAQWENSDG